jgi:biopolymer transport protein ExbD
MNFPHAEQATTEAPIDMTPMIDVVFLLVIFWLVVTSIASPTADRTVLPPASERAARSLLAPRVTIHVRPGEGAVYRLRSATYDLDALADRLALLAADAPFSRRPVLIRADGGADCRAVSALLGVLGRLGVQRVDFAARVP